MGAQILSAYNLFIHAYDHHFLTVDDRSERFHPPDSSNATTS